MNIASVVPILDGQQGVGKIQGKLNTHKLSNLVLFDSLPLAGPNPLM